MHHLINTTDDFQVYQRRVLSFLGHSHLDRGVAYALLSLVPASRDQGTPMVDHGGFCLDVTINGVIYTFAYSRREYRITVREGHKNGPVLAGGSFDEHSTVADVERLMHRLRPSDPCRFHGDGHSVAA